MRTRDLCFSRRSIHLLVGRLDRLLRGRLVIGLLPSRLLLLLVGRGRSLLLNLQSLGQAHRDLEAVADDVSHLLEVLEPALLLLLRSSSCWPGPGLLLPHRDDLQ